MPSPCAIQGCRMTHEISRVLGLNISFFGIPKNDLISQEWLRYCKPGINIKYAMVCSSHFDTNDFERDLKSELLGLKPKLLLKKTAIPSIKVPTTQEESNDTGKVTEEDHSFKCLPSTIETDTISIETVEEDNIKILTKSATSQTDTNLHHALHTEVEKEVSLLQCKITEAQLEIEKLKEHLNRKQAIILKQRRKLSSLSQQVRKLKQYKENKNVRQAIRSKMAGVFTTKQLDKVLTKKKVRWNEEDINIAFTLRYLSKRSYLYLRNHLNYPLPGESTLHMWCSKINMDQGILHSMFMFLSVAAKNFNIQERLTVLSFDEMKVSEIYEYDPKKDQVIGPHSQMQVVIARGLFGAWKQPIFADFDTRITKDILNTLIGMLHGIGYEVVACVCDCGPTNVGLWRELNVTYDKPSISHIHTGNNIYFFADAPHLLKLVRNWLLDSEFVIDGTTINKYYLEKLIEDCRTEISSCYKLCMEHVQCEGPRRQNVKLAAQLLSHTTATALKRYYGNSKEAVALSEFISIVNNWFDIMNSHIPNNSVILKSGYGKYVMPQNNVLDTMYSTITAIRFKNKKTLQTFQKGIAMSINSLKSLYSDMKKLYNIEYILTHRLNQDVLENLFSQVRTRGGLNDHPTPVSALQRIRIIALGKSSSISKNLNTEEVKSSEFITGQVLAQIELTPKKQSTTSSFSDKSADIETIPPPDTYVTMASEDDGLQYLAGWIARKLMKVHKGDFSHVTYQHWQDHTYAVPSWVQQLSLGGLTVPNADFKTLIGNLEGEFKKYLGEDIDHRQKIVKKLYKKIIPHFPENFHPIIKIYIKQRLFIRINFLNKKYENLKKSQHFKRKIFSIKKKLAKFTK